MDPKSSFLEMKFSETDKGIRIFYKGYNRQPRVGVQGLKFGVTLTGRDGDKIMCGLSPSAFLLHQLI